MPALDLDSEIGGVAGDAGKRERPVERTSLSSWADNFQGDDVFANEFDERQLEPHETDDRGSEPEPRRGPHKAAIGVFKTGDRRLEQFEDEEKGSGYWSTMGDIGHRLLDKQKQLERRWNLSVIGSKISFKRRGSSKKSMYSLKAQDACPYVLPQLADSGKVELQFSTSNNKLTPRGENTDIIEGEILYPGVSELPTIPDEDHQYGDWLSPKYHNLDEDQHEGNAGSGYARETFSTKATNGSKVSKAKVSGGLGRDGPEANSREPRPQPVEGQGSPHDTRNGLAVGTEECGADSVNDPPRVHGPDREANPREDAKISCDIFPPANIPQLPPPRRHRPDAGRTRISTRRSLSSLLTAPFTTKKPDSAAQNLSRHPETHIDVHHLRPARTSSKSAPRDHSPEVHLTIQETTVHPNLLPSSSRTSSIPDVLMSPAILAPEDSQLPMTQDTLLSTPEMELRGEKHNPDDSKLVSDSRFTENTSNGAGHHEHAKPRRRKLKRSTIHRLHDRFISNPGGVHESESIEKPGDIRPSQSLDLISSDTTIEAFPQRQKMSRTERVFALRMRDMLASRSQQPMKDNKERGDGDRTINVKAESEMKRYSEDTGSKDDIVASSPQKKSRLSQPTPAPNIPLPADPPAELVRASSLRRLQDPLSVKSKSRLQQKAMNRHSHSGECLTFTAPDNDCEPESTSSTKFRSNRHSHVGVFHNNEPPHTVAHSSEPDAVSHETKEEQAPNSQTTPPGTARQTRDDNLRNRPSSNHTNGSIPSLRHSPSNDSSRPLTPTQGNASPQHNVAQPESPQQLEARIALLERQNKMLQAALIAALDVGVTFDADVVRNHTFLPSPAAVIVGSSRPSSVKDKNRRSYASTITDQGAKHADAGFQRQSYASNKSADSSVHAEKTPAAAHNKRTSAHGNSSAGNSINHSHQDMPISNGDLGVHLPEPGQR